MVKFPTNLKSFWETHPALLPAFGLLLGIGASLFQLSILTIVLFALYALWNHKWASLCLLAFGALYAVSFHPPTISPTACTGRFIISSLQEHQTPFQKNLTYRGTLYFDGHNFPCKISHSKGRKRPKANRDYYVTGTLYPQDSFGYQFKTKQWVPIRHTWNLAELRFQSKEKIRKFLYKHFHRPKTAVFLSSLATGDSSDRQIIFEFSRLGLQHLLAISGFHFGVLMAFITVFFRFFLPSPWKWGALLILMTGYFIFIGASPAVQRSWIGASLFIIAKLSKRRAIPLNILGAAMMIELLWNPLSVANLGFQFSFGSCFGIILLYQPIEGILRKILPKRRAKEALNLTLPAQLAYLTTSSLRRSLSLTLSVNIAIIPIMFFHFGKFPLLSLLYNLFFPPLVGLILVGLLFSLLLHLLTGFVFVFQFLDWFSEQLLDVVSYPPLFLDRAIYLQHFPYQAIPLYFFVLLLAVLIYRNKNYQISTIKTK